MNADPHVLSTHKFVIVLNRKIETGVALNACAHMSVCLVATADEETRKQLSILDYVDAADIAHPASALSLIVLQAKNSNQIRAARNTAEATGITYVDFIETMTKDTYIEQLQRTRETVESDLEYWGIAMFGPKADLDLVTKRFSLWR